MMALKKKILLILTLTLTTPTLSLPTAADAAATTVPFLPSGFFGPGVSSDVVYRSTTTSETTMHRLNPTATVSSVVITSVASATATDDDDDAGKDKSEDGWVETTTEYRLPFRYGVPHRPSGETKGPGQPRVSGP